MFTPFWRVRVGMRKKFKSEELKHLGENPCTPQVTAVSRSWQSFCFMRTIVRLPQGSHPKVCCTCGKLNLSWTWGTISIGCRQFAWQTRAELL